MSGHRRVSSLTSLLAYSLNSRTLIYAQPQTINRQNEIPAHLPAQAPSLIARAGVLPGRARFLSRDCGTGMIRQVTDSQRLDKARRRECASEPEDFENTGDALKVFVARDQGCLPYFG